jgi:LysR family transcriptional regulator, nitrogen assimilation regulatory protein
MDLKQLRTFMHVAELGRISLAAERLNIAQSALTRQIQALEDELQCKLFRRHGRGVDPTPEGERLRARAAIILREVEQVRLDFSADPSVLEGELAFGAPPSVAGLLTGRLVEKFHQLYPRVRIHAHSGASGFVLDWLQRGYIDLGIVYDPQSLPTIHLTPLPEEQLYLIERPSGERPRSRTVRLSEVAAMPLVLPAKRHGLRKLLDGVAATRSLEMTSVAETDLILVQLELVERGLGATILPYSSVVDAVAAGRVIARLIVSPGIVRRMLIARPVDRPGSALVQRFSDLIVAEVEALRESGCWGGHPAD